MRKRAACVCAEKEGVGRGMGMSGTHTKHVFHVSNAGRVETQRLVECLRILCRVERESCVPRKQLTCVGWHTLEEGKVLLAPVRRHGSTSTACREVTGEWGPGMRGARPKHVTHVSNAGRVETQRLVEHRRTLPSQKRGIYMKRGEILAQG